jgi:tetratricopeptide (TPR) repeat protein
LAEPNQRLGSIYEELGRYGQAIDAYKQAINVEPEKAIQAYNNLAWIYAQQKTNLNEALIFAQKSLNLDPGNSSALDTLGWIQYLKQMYGDAIKNLELAKISLPSDPTIRYHLGMAYYKMNMKANALAELNKSLEIDKNFISAIEARRIIKELNS